MAARIKCTDRHPQGRDMNLNSARQDLNAAAVGILGRQCPGLGVRLAAVGQPGHGASPGQRPVGDETNGTGRITSKMVTIRCADPAGLAGGCGADGQVVPEFAYGGWVLAAGPGREVFGPGAPVVPETAGAHLLKRRGSEPDDGVGAPLG